jgi:toxin ParE1/3/4
MYELIVTELAHQDLDRIVYYIAVELVNPIAATDFLDEVDRCYEFIKSNPWMYEKCQNKRLEKEGYRRAPIKSYLLVYKTDEVSKTVIILRFFYGARDYINLI